MKKNSKLCLSVLLCILLVAAVLLAACNDTKYTLTFVTNGGTTIKSVAFTEGQKINPPATTKEYFTFNGWYEDAQLTTEFTKFGSMPNHDVTVYAGWTAGESGRIVFVIDGDEVDEISGVVGQRVPTVDNPTKEGYTFAGWYRDAEHTQFYVLGTFPSGTLTLYAKWNKDTANYKFVTYVLNGVENEVPVLSGEKAIKPKTDDDVECVWYRDENYTREYDFNSDVYEDITLYGLQRSKGLTFEGGVVTGYTGNKDVVYVPEKTNGVTVTKIGVGAFEENLTLNYVVLPDSVTEIADYAFYSCKYLYSINITNNITRMGKYAFADCERMGSIPDLGGLSKIEEGAFGNCGQLLQVKLAEGLTEIGENAFINCVALTSAELPDSVQTIGSYAFANTALTSISIPTSLTSWGKGVVKGCDLVVTGGNQHFVVDSEAGTLTNDGTLLLYFMTAANGEVDSYVLSDQTAIAPFAFYGNASIKHLDVSASADPLTLSSLEGIEGLESLTVQDFSATNPYLAYWFGASRAGTSSGLLVPVTLSRITFTEKFATTELVAYAFYGARGLSSVEGMHGVTSIGAYAFAYTELATFNVSASVTAIDNTAFRGAKSLVDISVENGNEHFSSDDGALYDAAKSTLIYVPEAKTSIIFASEVSAIADGAMYDSRVEKLEVPDSVETIGFGAFDGMNKLQELTVPFIGGSADNDRYMLYVFGATVEVKDDDQIQISDTKCPASLKIITISNLVSEIPDNAFLYCTRVSTVNLVEGYTSIGKAAFFAVGFDKIVVPDSVTEIGDYAFCSCENATSIVIGSGVTKIGEWAFADNAAVESIVFEEGEGDLEIGACAFMAQVEEDDYGVYVESSLKKLVLSNNIVSIGDEAFLFVGLDGTLGEKETYTYFDVEFDVANSRLKTIGDAAFNSTGVSKVVLPASIESIGTIAFGGCSVLGSVTIGSEEHEATELTLIDGGAFAGNPLMSSFKLYKSISNASGAPTLGSGNSDYVGDDGYGVFEESSNVKIYVPADSVDYYKSAWNNSLNQLAKLIFAI